MGDTSSIAVCIHFLGDKFKSNYHVVAFFNVETAIDFCPFSNSVTWNIFGANSAGSWNFMYVINGINKRIVLT